VKSLNAIYLIIFYHVEYYLTSSGRLVDRLLICMNGVDNVHDWFLIACEFLRIILELPLYRLLGV